MPEFIKDSLLADIWGYLSPVFAIHLFGVEIGSLELTVVLAVL